jgi:hypothetical protein
MGFERAQDFVSGAWHLARGIQILDTYQPLCAVPASMHMAADGGDERAEM